MKTPARQLLAGAIAAIFLALTFAAVAQEPPAPATPPAAPTASKPADQDKPALRRLDEPANSQAAKQDEDDDGDESANHEQVEKSDKDTKDQAAPAPAAPEEKKAGHKYHSYGYIKDEHSGDARVTIGGNSQLAPGDHADAVVSILGSSTAEGSVSDAVVSILGSSTSTDRVGDSVVSILGNTDVKSGHVGEAAVAVLGNNHVNGHVGDAVVAILGNVDLGPEADVGEVVCVGGTVHRDPKAIVRGQIQNVGVGAGIGHFSSLDWLHSWVTHCLVYGRLLAFAPHLGWAWGIALAFLVLYALLALLFHRGVEKCAETLEQRPGMSILATVLTVLLTPVVFILLIVTGVGIFLVPFLAAGLFIAKIFGKVVILAWLGRRILALAGGARNGPATALAVLIGGVIVMLLYAVPFVGFIVYHIVGLLGLGVVVYTLILGRKRKQAAPIPLVPPPPNPNVPLTPPIPPAPVAPVVPATPIIPPPPAAPMSAVAPDVVSEGAPPTPPVEPPPAAIGAVPPPAVPPPPAAASAVPPMPPPLRTVPPVIAATLPRAGFWIRLAASAIDAVLVGIGIGLLPHFIHNRFLTVYAIYCVVMWALKGTTVGGIVCGLKVVRLDDRPVDWVTAIVRALAGFLSLFVAGLGFIWVSFDEHRQSWHDKIAGTVIVQVPRGTPLV